MKFLTHVCLMISLSFYSCGYFFGEKHNEIFQCNKYNLLKIIPPDGTYKCKITLNTNTCLDEVNLNVLIDGDVYKKITILEQGVIYESDWYSNEFGLEYIPNQENEHVQDGSFDINITFFD